MIGSLVSLLSSRALDKKDSNKDSRVVLIEIVERIYFHLISNKSIRIYELYILFTRVLFNIMSSIPWINLDWLWKIRVLFCNSRASLMSISDIVASRLAEYLQVIRALIFQSVGKVGLIFKSSKEGIILLL